MTKEEFIKQYAKDSNMTVEKVLENMDAYPCACGDKSCKGWQMLSPTGAKVAKALGQIPDAAVAK